MHALHSLLEHMNKDAGTPDTHKEHWNYLHISAEGQHLGIKLTSDLGNYLLLS